MARQKNAKNIEDITQSLITLLQKSIVYEDQEMVCTLGEEIEMLKEYTTIQQYRYQDKFSVDIDISDDLLSYPVPRFILQPIVENSIFHGITPKAGQLQKSILFCGWTTTALGWKRKISYPPWITLLMKNSSPR